MLYFEPKREHVQGVTCQLSKSHGACLRLVIGVVSPPSLAQKLGLKPYMLWRSLQSPFRKHNSLLVQNTSKAHESSNAQFMAQKNTLFYRAYNTKPKINS